MSGNFDSEQWQNFNDRLSYWISKQGFWFQLRHSLPRTGQKGAFMAHFVNLVLRFGLFLLIAGIIYTYVVKLTGEEKFKENQIWSVIEIFLSITEKHGSQVS
jgi:hypothetical protein